MYQDWTRPRQRSSKSSNRKAHNMKAFVQLHSKKIKRLLRDVVKLRNPNEYAWHAIIRYQGCIIVVGAQSEDAETWTPLEGWDFTAPAKEVTEQQKASH